MNLRRSGTVAFFDEDANHFVGDIYESLRQSFALHCVLQYRLQSAILNSTTNTTSLRLEAQCRTCSCEGSGEPESVESSGAPAPVSAHCLLEHHVAQRAVELRAPSDASGLSDFASAPCSSMRALIAPPTRPAADTRRPKPSRPPPAP